MHNVTEIKNAVSQLSIQELSKFREWFEEYDAAAWDKQFEHDVKSGKLDQISEHALKNFAAGK